MRFEQRKTLATLRRVQVFLDNHQDRLGAVNAGGARTALNEVIVTLDGLAPLQDPMQADRKSERQAERVAQDALREKGMRPVATIARLELRKTHEFPQLRLPHKTVDSGTLVVWANQMAKAAALHKATFLARGLADDFIDKLSAAADALQQAINVRLSGTGSRAGITAKIHDETRRAVAVIGVIDAQVAPLVADDVKLAHDWIVTRRIARRAATAAAVATAPEATPAHIAVPNAPADPVTPNLTTGTEGGGVNISPESGVQSPEGV